MLGRLTALPVRSVLPARTGGPGGTALPPGGPGRAVPAAVRPLGAGVSGCGVLGAGVSGSGVLGAGVAEGGRLPARPGTLGASAGRQIGRATSPE
ncbi:hypothetical protein ABZS51_42690, partial [Nonomuraea sp. NPDC005501]